MMRAMYSGVSGLKTHQTKMDVIGNNIANVNTVAFKGSSTTFSEIMYQRLSGASGATANGRGGVNAKQIGLGVNMASTTVNITDPGATQTTGGAFDLAITGDSFFVVNNGSSNLFTKAGAFDVDGVGNLVMKSTGYNVMGWQVDPVTGTIRRDTVSPLRIMQEANLTSPPEATTLATCAGVVDKNSTQVKTDEGYAMSLNFVDALGYTYTAQFAVKETNVEGEYTVELKDVINSLGKSILDELDATTLDDIVTFGTQTQQTESILKKLNSDVTYEPGANQGDPGKYIKKVLFPDIATDYDAIRVSGFTYEEKLPAVVENAGVKTTTVTGKAVFTKEEVAKYFNIVYNETEKRYENNGVEVPSDNAAAWQNFILNAATDEQKNSIANFRVTNFDPDSGTIEFAMDQTFTVNEKLVMGNNGAELDDAGTSYLMEIDQREAYDGLEEGKQYSFNVANDGTAVITATTITKGNILKFDVDKGTFVSIGGNDAASLVFKDTLTTRDGQIISLGNFSDISIDFTGTKRFDNGGASTMGVDAGGGQDGAEGMGKKLGALIGLSVSQDGTIWGNYDNGNTTLLGQIAVAVFSNPAGLEKVGENCYQTTLNSGDFDGIGQDVSADGGKMTSGVLEMSNVDLSREFTEMITTQRGFQANSRIITTSDTLLEELINLKR